MRLSDNGRVFLQGLEGLSLKAYRDADGYSIGYGHFLGKDPSLASRVIDRAEADRLFASDVARFENIVSLGAVSPLQHEFDAMVSLTYNIGTGDKDKSVDKAGGFWGSTVRRLHNAGDKQGAADAFRLWNKSTNAAGVRAVDPVLVARREKERAFYLGSGNPPPGSFPTPPPEQSTEGWPPTIATAPSSPSPSTYASASALSLVTLALGWLFYRLVHR